MAAKVNIAIAVAFGGAVVALVALIPRDGARPVPVTVSPPPGPEPKPAPDEISVLSLVDEMIDLDRLARVPADGDAFVARQESSYDRRSRRPEDGESWFANDDFVTPAAPNLVRVETTPDGARRYVLLDAKGPGVVTRLWTATPAGTVRITIDDGAQPALEAPLGELLSGAVAPFEPPFGQITAMGYSLYFPFPFRSRCLITLDSITSVDPFSGRPVDKLYYQVGYRQYPAGVEARVRPYSSAEVQRAVPALVRVAAALRAGEVAPGGAERTVPIARTELRPGQSVTTSVDAPAGGGAITTLRFTTPERDPTRLRGTILTISFDGAETVRAPLVDFFGTGPGWNPTVSLPFTVGADGTLTSRFVMPFGKTAAVTLSRPAAEEGGPAVQIAGALTVAARPFTGDGRALFHARFRAPDALPTRPLRDWHVATISGRGRQVGTVLDVENPPGVAWWGEGDEKIYVDGATFPDIFGTGTEDYFGYAWSSTAPFAHPYHALTLAPGSGFSGAFSMNRFLIADPLPFTSKLRFDFELWHWSDTTVRLSALLYWYAAPGGSDDFPP